MISNDYDKHVRWYHWLWFLIPIAGVAFFVAAVKDAKDYADRNL